MRSLLTSILLVLCAFCMLANPIEGHAATPKQKRATAQHQQKGIKKQKKAQPAKRAPQKKSSGKAKPQAKPQKAKSVNQRQPAPRKNVTSNNYQNSWSKGTFPTNQASINYHTNKHGNGRSQLQYTRDASNFYERNKNLRQATNLSNGEQGYRINKGTQGGIWTNDGKIVTYWD